MENINCNQQKLCDMSQLFHTLLQHKDSIDVHKRSTVDRYILFKDKSTSWQRLIKLIRSDAYNLLHSIVLEMDSKCQSHAEIISYLKAQRNNPLFCLHRGNHWYEKFGVTDTVKKIDGLITHYEAIHERIASLNTQPI